METDSTAPRPMPLLLRSVGMSALTATVLTAIAACGSTVQNPTQPNVQSTSAPFAWFNAAPAPAGWKTMELPDGTGVLSIPPDAHSIDSDPGSVSAAVTAPGGELRVYLNATPQQGNESLENWNTFRLDHLADENSSAPTKIADRTGMTFRRGVGSCVDDSYVTRIGDNRYREIACLVEGTRGGSVLIAAAPAESWDLYSPVLEQAVDSYLVK